MKDSIYELGALGLITSLLIAIPLGNIVYIVSLGLSYFLLFYLPFAFIIDNLKLSIVEKFMLINAAGLSYGLVYVLLDVYFRLSLTKVTFLAITSMIYTLSFFLSKNIK